MNYKKIKIITKLIKKVKISLEKCQKKEWKKVAIKIAGKVEHWQSKVN